MDNIIVSNELDIPNKIHTIRGVQVMLDRDLAELYQVENRVLNQAVKRNIDRFPGDFMFQLSKEEFENWKSQFVTSNSDKMGLRKMPYAFTEQGVSMLSAVLRSDIAVKVSVEIVRAFVNMRKLIASNELMFQRFERVEQRLSEHDKTFEKIFNAIEDKSIRSKQGIFYDGQVFDAYVFVSDLIKSSKKSIVLIDNYVDESVLTLFSKNQSIDISIYSKNISKQLKLDLKKYNSQYNPIELKPFTESHDRFMIIDDHEVYHFGASLKDLGKKWFAFSRFDVGALEMLGRLR